MTTNKTGSGSSFWLCPLLMVAFAAGCVFLSKFADKLDVPGLVHAAPAVQVDQPPAVPQPIQTELSAITINGSTISNSAIISGDSSQVAITQYGGNAVNSRNQSSVIIGRNSMTASSDSSSMAVIQDVVIKSTGDGTNLSIQFPNGRTCKLGSTGPSVCKD